MSDKPNVAAVTVKPTVVTVVYTTASDDDNTGQNRRQVTDYSYTTIEMGFYLNCFKNATDVDLL